MSSATTGLVLEFVSDMHNSVGETGGVVQGGFEYTYECVAAVEYGCTDPQAGNYVTTVHGDMPHHNLSQGYV